MTHFAFMRSLRLIELLCDSCAHVLRNRLQYLFFNVLQMVCTGSFTNLIKLLFKYGTLLLTCIFHDFSELILPSITRIVVFLNCFEIRTILRWNNTPAGRGNLLYRINNLVLVLLCFSRVPSEKF